ncbi:hypothetical protein NN561_009879 [Cricetulus griseus]
MSRGGHRGRGPGGRPPQQKRTRGTSVARSAALDVFPTEKGLDEEGGTAPATHALRGHPRQLQAACTRLLRPVRLLPVSLLPQRLHLPRAQPQLLNALPRCARSLRDG